MLLGPCDSCCKRLCPAIRSSLLGSRGPKVMTLCILPGQCSVCRPPSSILEMRLRSVVAQSAVDKTRSGTSHPSASTEPISLGCRLRRHATNGRPARQCLEDRSSRSFSYRLGITNQAPWLGTRQASLNHVPRPAPDEPMTQRLISRA